MSYLKAIAETLDGERYRLLGGGDTGIARAILRREEPQHDDWEWLGRVVTAALKREHEIYLEGQKADAKRDAWAKELAKKPEAELRKRLAQITGQSAGPEVLSSGTRSTNKATRNEGARNAYPERLAIEDALTIQHLENRGRNA